MKQGEEEELYIITESGSIVFEHSISNEGETTKKLMMASALTAILQFIKVSSGEDISSFNFGKHTIYIKRNPDYQLMYVLIYPLKGKKAKDEELNKKLDTIQKEFEQKYSRESIINWKGLMGAFDDFKLVLDKGNKRTEDILAVFKKGLW
jgi:hypothetical protein